MALLTYSKKFLMENLALKLTALALSFMMWVTISNDQLVEKVLSVRLEYQHIPDGMEIANQQTGVVDIYVRMPGRRSSISEADFRASIDLKDTTPGQKIIHLDPQKNVTAPPGVEVLKLSPPRITLSLERTVQAVVAIESVLEGTPTSGYEVVNTFVTPAKIYIAGPESHVKSVTSARTETVSIQNKRALVNAWVNINVEDPTIRIVDTKPVQVTVEIGEKRREVWVEKIPIQVVPEDRPIRLRPEVLKLSVSVPLSFNQKLSPDFFQATVNVSDIDPAEKRALVKPEVNVKKDAPPDMKIVSILPPAVEVIPEGRKRPSTTR